MFSSIVWVFVVHPPSLLCSNPETLPKAPCKSSSGDSSRYAPAHPATQPPSQPACQPQVIQPPIHPTTCSCSHPALHHPRPYHIQPSTSLSLHGPCYKCPYSTSYFVVSSGPRFEFCIGPMSLTIDGQSYERSRCESRAWAHFSLGANNIGNACLLIACYMCPRWPLKRFEVFPKKGAIVRV